MLLLTLAAGHGRVEGSLGVVRVYSMTVIMRIKKYRLGCGFRYHGPLHIVIVSPDGTDLVE